MEKIQHDYSLLDYYINDAFGGDVKDAAFYIYSFVGDYLHLRLLASEPTDESVSMAFVCRIAEYLAVAEPIK
jgi:hypothetical protein